MNTAFNPHPPKVGLVFLGRKRPGFDMDWGKQLEGKVREGMTRTGFVLMEPEEKAVDEPSFRRVINQCKGAGVDALVLLQTTMADGRMAPALAQLWPDPPILWATPENPQGDMVSSCSLVGQHLWGSILRQVGHPFEVVNENPDEPGAWDRIAAAIRRVTTARRLKGLRLGLVGPPSPGFMAMAGDPLVMGRELGVQVQDYSLLQFADAVNAIEDDKIAEDVAAVKAIGWEHKDTADEDLPMASRLYLAMRNWFQEEHLDALALRCWPELPNTFGQWPYLGMARLAEEGLAIACEGDADGAVSAWLGESLGMGRCYLSDWLEHDEKTITLWHGGAAPPSLSPPTGEPGGPRIARHFNTQKPAVLEAEIRGGMPLTLFRLWRADGRYHICAEEGESIQPQRQLMGTHGVVRLNQTSPAVWFEKVCHAGMPHHLVAFPGTHADTLRRFARLAGIQWIG